MEHCNTISLYTIKLMMIIQGTIELRYNIRSAWFLDIRISTCFTGSYFRVLAFILFGEVIFVEEKFAYRWSIKKLTVPGEVLFSAGLAGTQAAAETNIHNINV